MGPTTSQLSTRGMQPEASLARRVPAFVLAAVLASAAASAAEGPSPASSAAARAAIAESTRAILEGDSARATSALEAVPAAQFDGKDATYRACMLERHRAGAPVFALAGIDDPFVRDVLRDYQDYWWRAMASPSERAGLENRLLAKLRRRVGAGKAEAGDMDAIEASLRARLLERGYHALLGQTLPLRELMLWRRQETRAYDVQLPDGPYRVRVELLDDFASLGWAAYGRCDRGSTGGWATADALYAVVPSYDEGLDSERFRVVFLGHETQHLADQNAFPGIVPWELEYRAKLVELAQAREVSAERLGYMISAQGDDLDSPHTYANKRVVADLTTRLGRSPERVDIDTLQEAAREQLGADTRRRTSAP
jgi:hypothetical protein